jgi:hypothetical protein
MKRPRIEKDGLWKCSACGDWKAKTEFWEPQRPNKQGEKRPPVAKCHACRRQRSIANNYVLTLQEYQALLAQANGKCQVCQCQLEKSEVDHDHETGQIRGILCRRCNLLVHDMVHQELLDQATAYLKHHAARLSQIPITKVDMRRLRNLKTINDRKRAAQTRVQGRNRVLSTRGQAEPEEGLQPIVLPRTLPNIVPE